VGRGILVLGCRQVESGSGQLPLHLPDVQPLDLVADRVRLPRLWALARLALRLGLRLARGSRIRFRPLSLRSHGTSYPSALPVPAAPGPAERPGSPDPAPVPPASAYSPGPGRPRPISDCIQDWTATVDRSLPGPGPAIGSTLPSATDWLS